MNMVYGRHMREDYDKTTVYLVSADYRALKGLARREGRYPAELVREAIAEYVVRREAASRPRSIGAGRSREGDVAERAEEYLAGLGSDAFITSAEARRGRRR